MRPETTMQLADEREADCAIIAQEAAQWIVKRLAGTKGTGFRGTADLESDIYSWLWEHAIFEDEADEYDYRRDPANQPENIR